MGITVGVAYYSLCIYIVFWDTDKSELRESQGARVREVPLYNAISSAPFHSQHIIMRY